MKRILLALLTATLAFGSQAQNDSTLLTSTNPLVATTGPNVLGPGRLMLEGSFEGYMKEMSNLVIVTDDGPVGYNYRNLEAKTLLRFGVGSSTELMLGLSASHASGILIQQSIPDDNLTVTPAVGVRMKLYDGGLKWYQPRIAFLTTIGLPYRQGTPGNDDNEVLVEPLIGIQARHHLGHRLMLDWQLDYTWNEHYPSIEVGNGPHCMLALRWLPTDRWLLGVGSDIGMSWFEACWQATPALQLSAHVGASLGLSLTTSGNFINANALLGASWRLR